MDTSTYYWETDTGKGRYQATSTAAAIGHLLGQYGTSLITVYSEESPGKLTEHYSRK